MIASFGLAVCSLMCGGKADKDFTASEQRMAKQKS